MTHLLPYSSRTLVALQRDIKSIAIGSAFVLVSLVAFTAHAQSISHQVIGSSGVTDPEMSSLVWTVGEVAVSTATGGVSMITEGFHQPLLHVEPMDANIGSTIIGISVYPNPFSDVLLVKVNETFKDGRAVLYDLSGREVFQTSLDNESKESRIDLSKLAAAAYILSVTTEDSQISRSFRVVKASY
jgi:hypothetical protein